MEKPITIEQSNYLKYIYYTKKNYFGRERLYEKLKSDNMDITKKQLQSWLNDQEINQLYKPTRLTTNIKTTILKEPNKQIGIDIIDMTPYEFENKKYIFTGIDLFSKKGYAYAMDNKSDSYDALTILIKVVGHQISSIRSDNGSEFIADKFKKILAKNNITQVFSLPGKPQSNGNIERFNSTLKRLLKMYMRINNAYDWPDVLGEMTDNYNNTKQRITDKIPNKINETDYKIMNENIKNNVMNVSDDNNKTKFNIDDKVRVKNKETDDYGIRWSRKIYTITQVNKPKTRVSSVYYTIDDDSNKHYYNNDLQLIKNVDNKIPDENFDIVSKLIKPLFDDGIRYYEVKWKYDKNTTLQTRDILMEDVPKLVSRYEKMHNVNWGKKTVVYN